MRIFFAFLFAMSSVFAQVIETNTQPLEAHQHTIILPVDRSHPTKFSVIQNLLELQQSLIIPFDQPIPEENGQNGFLLVPMTKEYVLHLLDRKGSYIICAYRDLTLVGYAILTEVPEFKELYKNKNLGSLETSIDTKTLNDWLSKPRVGYIEQIAVMPGFARTGIGTRLMNTCKMLKPNGLIADVFIYPVKNQPSLAFFSKQGFTPSAILHQTTQANPNFPYIHRTQVLFWNMK